jgi:hypothetical protein
MEMEREKRSLMNEVANPVGSEGIRATRKQPVEQLGRSEIAFTGCITGVQADVQELLPEGLGHSRDKQSCAKNVRRLRILGRVDCRGASGADGEERGSATAKRLDDENGEAGQGTESARLIDLGASQPRRIANWAY